MIIEWRRYPVVSERFGRLLGTVDVPGEPEKFEPGCVMTRSVGATKAARGIPQNVVHSTSARLRWDAAKERYIAPEGFPLGRIETFRQL